jgi:hypothetical protein
MIYGEICFPSFKEAACSAISGKAHFQSSTAQVYIRASVSRALAKIVLYDLHWLCVSAVGAYEGFCPPVIRRVLGAWRMSESRR